MSKISSYFRKCHHQEFIFLSILPVLAATILYKKDGFDGITNRLQKLDRFLAKKVPFISKYYWETVIVLEK